MIKGNKIIDLIRGEYTGRWPQKYKTTDNGKKPIIRPSGFNSAQVFPHALNPDENVKEFTTFTGETIHVLVPSNGIYNFNDSNLSDTPWFQLTDTREEKLKEKDETIEELKDHIAELESKLERHTDEDVKDKYSGGSSSSTTRLSCSSCGRVHTESEWENNGGTCPWCERGSINNAEVIQ